MVKNKEQKGGINMALLARPSEGIITIDKNKSKEFLEDSKKNTIPPDFLKKCLQYAKMMRGK